MDTICNSRANEESGSPAKAAADSTLGGNSALPMRAKSCGNVSQTFTIPRPRDVSIGVLHGTTTRVVLIWHDENASTRQVRGTPSSGAHTLSSILTLRGSLL